MFKQSIDKCSLCACVLTLCENLSEYNTTSIRRWISEGVCEASKWLTQWLQDDDDEEV